MKDRLSHDTSQRGEPQQQPGDLPHLWRLGPVFPASRDIVTRCSACGVHKDDPSAPEVCTAHNRRRYDYARRA